MDEKKAKQIAGNYLLDAISRSELENEIVLAIEEYNKTAEDDKKLGDRDCEILELNTMLSMVKDLCTRLGINFDEYYKSNISEASIKYELDKHVKMKNSIKKLFN